MTVAGATALSVEISTNARDAVLAGDRRQRAGGERVVAHRLDRVVLHQRDVLVRGGVEDDLRAVLGEHLGHALGVLAVGQHGDRAEDVALADELALDLEQVRLAVVDQHEPARVHARDLAAELGADRAARAGDQHAAAGQVAADGLDLHPHGLAAEDVLDPHLAQLAGEWLPPCSSSKTVGIVRTGTPRSRQALTTVARSLPGADGIAISTSSGSTSSSTSASSYVVPSTSSRVDAHALLARVVVDEADRAVAELRVAQQLAQQQLAAVAGADDQHRARVAPGAEAAAAGARRRSGRGSACRSGTRPSAARRARARRPARRARRSRSRARSASAGRRPHNRPARARRGRCPRRS